MAGRHLFGRPAPVPAQLRRRAGAASVPGRSGFRQVVQVERPACRILRAALATAEVFAFYLAVSYLPLAVVMTYWLAAPIYIAALSPLFLGDMSAGGAGWPVAIGFSWRAGRAQSVERHVHHAGGHLDHRHDVLLGHADARPFPAQHLGTVLVFWQMAGATIVGAATVPFEWVTPTLFDLLWMALLGVVAMLAHI